jgi:hypothetical protein
LRLLSISLCLSIFLCLAIYPPNTKNNKLLIRDCKKEINMSCLQNHKV